RPGPAVKQQRIRCTFDQSTIRVTGFLLLQGMADLPMEPGDFALRYNAPDGKEYAGKVRGGQKGFVLSSTAYQWIDIAAQRDPGEADKTVVPGTGCRLVLITDLYGSSGSDVPDVSDRNREEQ